MFRWILNAVGLLLIASGVHAQLSRFYIIKESSEFDTVDFHLKATAANCHLKRLATERNPLTIYGDPDLDKINPSFLSEIKDNTCHAKLILDEYNSSSFSNSFSMAVSRNTEDNDFWKMDLNEGKIYKLNLMYGFGHAEVDLTDIKINQLKISSGSADIVVGYDQGNPNPVKMDTFYLKTDFGSIVANHMELTRAGHVITKVGFGNVLLDFDRKITEKCTIYASVGAGNLEVLLAEGEMPILIRIKNSPLCAVKLEKGFEEIEKDVFVNTNYSLEAENLLTFNIDVALGMVRFKYTD